MTGAEAKPTTVSPPTAKAGGTDHAELILNAALKTKFFGFYVMGITGHLERIDGTLFFQIM